MYSRPHWSVLNESIPMLLIGQNKAGLWVVCDSNRRELGVFSSQALAVRFAERECVPGGCALMYLDEPIDSEDAPKSSGS
jgi:hypothetical protein